MQDRVAALEAKVAELVASLAARDARIVDLEALLEHPGCEFGQRFPGGTHPEAYLISTGPARTVSPA